MERGAWSVDRRSSRTPTRSPVTTNSTSPPRFRLAKAYLVTLRVLGSYLALRLRRPLLTPDAYERRLLDRHRSNARRVEQTILELDGLFIKVGQLISILANFLPEEFRRELEGLQDQIPARPVEQIVQRI